MGKDTIYEMVTDQIVAALEAGTVPWRKPWNPTTWPRNIEGHRYRGANLFLLAYSPYESPFWLTYKQATERGGSVRGEKTTMITFWKRLMVTDKDTGERAMIPMLRFYRVFNLEQVKDIERLPQAVRDWSPADTVPDPIAEAEAIVKGYPNPPHILVTASDEAFYMPGLDQITVPSLRQYDGADEYYATLFHEMGHSTGHPDRLARKYGKSFGSHDYGREELVAEMTAAFLCGESGITMTMDNSAAYLASWIKTIKEDTRAVVTAAGAAQRAADHILGRTFEDRADQAEDTNTEKKMEVVA